MEEEWVNWSGSLKFTPKVKENPRNEEEAWRIILRARSQGKKIRMVGAGHSSVPLVKTEQILLAQDHLKGIVDHDRVTHQIKILPGTDIAETGKELIKLNMSMHNTGDVDMQFLGGAFGTGTHGSGKTLQNLSGMIKGCRMIDGKGELHEFTEKDPEILKAIKVSLGALGFFTQFTIQVKKAEKFVRKEFCTHIDSCLEHLDELIYNNNMFDFYWYPRNDLVKLRICNQADIVIQDIPFADLVKEDKGWMYEILPRKRTLKYEEMEYALPFEAGPQCFKAVRQRIKEKHRQYVGWRVLYRTIAADDAFLSPCYNRDTVTISILQNNELEYKSYFNDMEPIFRAYGGRPHWGKKHSLTAAELQPLYPEWDKFMKLRREFDPDGIFLNDYLRKVLSI